jgi:hypothetical protein
MSSQIQLPRVPHRSNSLPFMMFFPTPKRISASVLKHTLAATQQPRACNEGKLKKMDLQGIEPWTTHKQIPCRT